MTLSPAVTRSSEAKSIAHKALCCLHVFHMQKANMAAVPPQNHNDIPILWKERVHHGNAIIPNIIITIP
jgi:hypothetical protein